MADQNLTPQEIQAQLDYQTSPTSGASPAQSPYSNRAFWGAYKNLSRGLWGGILVGSTLGLVIGSGLGAIALAAGMGSSIALGVVAAATVGTMAYYAEKFSLAGATAGAVSTAIEIYEERKATEALEKGEALTKGQKETLERKAKNGNGELKNDYTPENNPADERFRPYYWNVGLAGAALGAIVGGIASSFGLGEHMLDSLGSLGETLVSLGQGPLTTLFVGGGALAGATFGINRYYLRQPFYFANALFEGDLSQFSKQREHEKQLTREFIKSKRIEPELEELAPYSYVRDHSPMHTANLSQETQLQENASAKPGTKVKEASWGFELSTTPGKRGAEDATVTYNAVTTQQGKELFKEKFHGSWEDFQKKMKEQLETAANQSRQA
ncbi:MAG: hypothetical protein U1E36_03565 [Rickettsiales bacterium]